MVVVVVICSSSGLCVVIMCTSWYRHCCLLSVASVTQTWILYPIRKARLQKCCGLAQSCSRCLGLIFPQKRDDYDYDYCSYCYCSYCSHRTYRNYRSYCYRYRYRYRYRYLILSSTKETNILQTKQLLTYITSILLNM